MRLINQLSKETGIPIGTLRFYEKSGFFSGQHQKGITNTGTLYYDDEVVEKLRYIQLGKAAGFSLTEIKQLIDVWYKNELSKETKQEVLDLKLFQIEQKLAGLEAMKKQINLCKLKVEQDNDLK